MRAHQDSMNAFRQANERTTLLADHSKHGVARWINLFDRALDVRKRGSDSLPLGSRFAREIHHDVAVDRADQCIVAARFEEGVLKRPSQFDVRKKMNRELKFFFSRFPFSACNYRPCGGFAWHDSGDSLASTKSTIGTRHAVRGHRAFYPRRGLAWSVEPSSRWL